MASRSSWGASPPSSFLPPRRTSRGWRRRSTARWSRHCRNRGDMSMTTTERRPSLDDLRRTSVEARKLIVQAIHHAGAGHLGGPLSAADILVALYFDQMNVDPGNPGL